MSLMIGIDQGGTKTDVVIADAAGSILAVSNDSGFTDWTGGRRELRDKRLAYAARAAMSELNVSGSDVDMVVGACNGVDWEFERGLRSDSIQQLLGVKKVLTVNDVVGAMRCGTEIHQRNVAVLCIGTGSNVAVQSKDGETIVFGYYMRDALQGGAAIGKRVFELVFAVDIGLYEKSEMTGLLLNATGFDSVQELMMAVTTGRNKYEKPWPVQYKHYAWIMLEAYRRNDPLAKQYLRSLCQELVQFIVLGAKKLNARENLQVVFSGGIFGLCPSLAELCQELLHPELPDASYILSYRRPILGTVLMWLDKTYDYSIPPAVIASLEQQCIEKNLLYQPPASA